jgi:hypothetical protein
MARAFTMTDAASPTGVAQFCSGITTDARSIFDRACSDGATAGTGTTTTQVDTATLERGLVYETIGNEPNDTSWAAGNWTVRLNVTTGDTDIQADEVWICRINSGGTSQATVGSSTGLAEDLDARIHSWVISGSAQAGAAAGDRFVVLIGTKRKSGAHGNPTAVVTNDQDIDTPLAAAGADIDLTAAAFATMTVVPPTLEADATAALTAAAFAAMVVPTPALNADADAALTPASFGALVVPNITLSEANTIALTPAPFAALALPGPTLDADATVALDPAPFAALAVPTPALNADAGVALTAAAFAAMVLPAIDLSEAGVGDVIDLTPVVFAAMVVPGPVLNADADVALDPAPFAAMALPGPALSADAAVDLTPSPFGVLTLPAIGSDAVADIAIDPAPFGALAVPAPALDADATVALTAAAFQALILPAIDLTEVGGGDDITLTPAVFAAMAVPAPALAADATIALTPAPFGVLTVPLPELIEPIAEPEPPLEESAAATVFAGVQLHFRLRYLPIAVDPLLDVSIDDPEDPLAPRFVTILEKMLRTVKTDQPYIWDDTVQSVPDYMALLVAEFRILKGDPTLMKHAILTIRFRRGY